MTEGFPVVESIMVYPDDETSVKHLLIKGIGARVLGTLALRRIVRIAQETGTGTPLTFMRAFRVWSSLTTLILTLYPGVQPKLSSTRRKAIDVAAKQFVSKVEKFATEKGFTA